MNCITVRVGVHREGNGVATLTISLEEPPIGLGEARDLPCTPSDPEFLLAPGGDGAVSKAGDRLCTGLAGGHPDIGEVLQQAMHDVDGDRRPFYVELRAGAEAERIPWEALSLPDGTFVGLDLRWSIARVVASRIPQPGTRPFAPPLRIAVLLSCFGVPAAQEWAEIEAAVRGTALDVELLVFAGESDLADTIAQSNLPGLHVEGVPEPAFADELKRGIAKFRPHVIHFFCHGSTDQGPHLELASTADWLRGDAQTSLFLEAEAIGEFSDPIERTWLAVLNCCEGAASREQLHSLARNLVFDAGFPAVVGMREPILSEDATSFSRGFFRELFSAVLDCTAAGGGQLDWTKLLVDPRRNLVRRAGGVFTATARDRREWTLPVLYLRPDSFVLSPPTPAAAPSTGQELLLLELLRTMRSAASPDSPAPYLAELDQRIAELERRAGGP